MNLVYFIRLLFRNSLLILGIAILMAVLVYLGTRNQPKVYSSSSTVYTGIATGYDIESGANARFDLFSNNAQFDNLINIIKSRETQEKTAIRLMAQHLILSKPDSRYCLPETWMQLKSEIPDEIKQLVETVNQDVAYADILNPEDSASLGTDMPPGSNADIVSKEYLIRYNRLVQALTDFKEADHNNFLFKTLQSSNPFYSVQKISGVKVSRIQSSDLLKLSFESNDPAVCQQTLKIITSVFKSQYQSITTKQTGMVSEYFRQRVNAAKMQLDSLEQNLLQFRMKNRIINYDEQTKFISEQKETLERDWYEEAGKLSAAQTALKLIEENLGEKGKTILQNNSIIEKRKRIYELALQLSFEEIKDEVDIRSLTRLTGEIEKLKLDLHAELLNSFEDSRTTQGINIVAVLQKWLEKAIEGEESRARFNKLTERKNEFLKKYDEFAPLGSQLKKIEREIDLAQQDYMNHLNNLNISIMKQKNVEQSDIQIIDYPVYPVKPVASKRMITIVAAFLAGMVLTASMIILLEFLDTSIKFPERFAELSGLKLIGAFPRIPDVPDNRINYPLISSRAIGQIAQRIRLENLLLKNSEESPFVLFIISTRENEGKTYLAARIVEKLRASGSMVLYIKPLESNTSDEVRREFNSFEEHSQAWDFEYAIPENFISIRNVNELLRNYTFLTKGYNYLIIELPALLMHEYPAVMTQSGHLAILVGRATRAWNKADTEAVGLFEASFNHTILALLNGCQADHLESIIGEIPKRRSLIRKLAKKMVTLDFKAKNVI